MRSLNCFILSIAVLGAAVPSLRAEAAPGSRPPAAFPRGTWELETGGAFAWEFYPYDHEKIASGWIGGGCYLADNFAATVRVPVYHVRQFDGDATMAGLDLSLRYHFYQQDRLTLFADLIGGLAQSDREVPPGGTYFNFTLQGGIGATFQVADHVYLMGGFHVFHLSNAAINGIERNPDLNAAQPYVSLMFTF